MLKGTKHMMILKYSFSLRGEDHTEFVWDCEAASIDEAEKKLECIYPYATVIDVHTEQELQEIEEARYNRLADAYEYDQDIDSYWDI
jgi:hypothetical protein